MKYCGYCNTPLHDNEIVCSFCGREQQLMIPPHHLLPGTVLNGKYLIGQALGEGGFGITYVGTDTKLELKVAIKEYYPSGFANRSNTISAEISCGMGGERTEFFEKGRMRFLDEAKTLAKFSGFRGIVNVRDFFEENNTAYIVMEYLEGKTLKEYLQQQGTLPIHTTLNLLMPAMESLNQVHKYGLIHRDISPDNIMLVGNSVKLLDFGAARSAANAGNKSLSIMLKHGYAPEEQYRSRGIQGPWTDVYALCATIYKCITGITPDDATERVYKDELKRPSQLGVKINPTMEMALMKGLAVFKKDRWQNIEELLQGLRSGAKEIPKQTANRPIPQSRPAENKVMVQPKPVVRQSSVQEKPKRRGLSPVAIVFIIIGAAFVTMDMLGAILILLISLSGN